MTIDIIGIGAVVAAIITLGLFARALYRGWRKFNRFLDDWTGQGGDAGHTPVPGVMARLLDVEKARDDTATVLADQNTLLSQMVTDIAAIKSLMSAELGRSPGGTSTKDVAHEALRISQEMQAQQDEEIVARREWREEYEQDKETTRQEWVAVFSAIRRMFGMDPAEQAQFWDTVTATYAVGDVDKLRMTSQPE